MAGISGKAFVSVAANHPVLLTSSLTCVSPPLRRRSISRLTTPQTLICFHLRKTPQGRPEHHDTGCSARKVVIRKLLIMNEIWLLRLDSNQQPSG
jgi:hypothetical protein